MVQAYVLIQAEVGRSGEVARAVANIPGVRFADAVQAVEGVTRTMTCPVVRL